MAVVSVWYQMAFILAMCPSLTSPFAWGVYCSSLRNHLAILSSGSLPWITLPGAPGLRQVPPKCPGHVPLTVWHLLGFFFYRSNSPGQLSSLRALLSFDCISRAQDIAGAQAAQKVPKIRGFAPKGKIKVTGWPEPILSSFPQADLGEQMLNQCRWCPLGQKTKATVLQYVSVQGLQKEATLLL